MPYAVPNTLQTSISVSYTHLLGLLVGIGEPGRCREPAVLHAYARHRVHAAYLAASEVEHHPAELVVGGHGHYLVLYLIEIAVELYAEPVRAFRSVPFPAVNHPGIVLLGVFRFQVFVPDFGVVAVSYTHLNYDALSKENILELLEDMKSEGQWLVRMVENLLSITRIGDGTARINKEDELVEDVISGAITQFRKRFPDIEVCLLYTSRCV